MGALNTHDFLREKVAEPLNALIAETTFAQIGKTRPSPPSGGRSTTINAWPYRARRRGQYETIDLWTLFLGASTPHRLQIQLDLQNEKVGCHSSRCRAAV